MRWPGQGELEAMLRTLIEGERRRELAAACATLAITGSGHEVRGLDGPLAVLQQWLRGEGVDVARAADLAEQIASNEGADHTRPVDEDSIDSALTDGGVLDVAVLRASSPQLPPYGVFARADLVASGCRVAAGGAWPDPAVLAYNALSAVSRTPQPTNADILAALAAVRSVLR